MPVERIINEELPVLIRKIKKEEPEPENEESFAISEQFSDDERKLLLDKIKQLEDQLEQKDKVIAYCREINERITTERNEYRSILYRLQRRHPSLVKLERRTKLEKFEKDPFAEESSPDEKMYEEPEDTE